MGILLDLHKFSSYFHVLISLGSHTLFLAEKEPVSDKTELSGCSLSGNLDGKTHPGLGVSAVLGLLFLGASALATELTPVLPPPGGV